MRLLFRVFSFCWRVVSGSVATLGLFLFFVGVLKTGEVHGQMEVKMRHYTLNQLDFNPAYAGSQGLINVYSFGRQQWVGFGKGAPRSILFSFDMPFSYRKLSQMAPGRKMQYSHGLGVHFVRNEMGFLAENSVQLNYTSRFHLRSIGSLAFAVGFWACNDRFKAEWRAQDGVENDPAVPDAKANTLNLDVSFGVYFDTEHAYFGLSAKNLLGGKLRSRLSKSYKSRPRLDYAREYYIVAGYDISLADRWSLEPSFLYRSDLVQHSVMTTLRAQYNNLVWFGLGYSVKESLGVLLGVNLFNGFRIGYSYDFPLMTRELWKVTSGSHEVVLGYSFSLIRERKPQYYKSVRYL